MSLLSRFVGGLIVSGLMAIGFIIGCTRQIAIAPVAVVPVFTSTPVDTNTPTNSPTVTSTSTPTNTLTPVGPTYTSTNTPTITFTDTITNTPTITSTPTNTYTPTITFTETLTPTVTQTPTATVNPNMVADFDEGGTQDVTTNGLGLNGVWYQVGSTGTNFSPTTLTLATNGGCNSNSNYIYTSGTTGAVSVFAALQGDFVDVSSSAVPYNISASYNAFVFCVEGTVPGNQVFFAVSDAATSATSDNAGIMVPVTGSWQSVTVCFNHMESQGFGVTTVGHMFDPTTAISFSWKVTTPSSPFNIAIDNFQLATVPGANCPAFTSTPTPDPKLIDNFQSGTNQIFVENGRNGYWYCYSDLGKSGALSSSVVLSGANAITVVPGETVASNPISIQVGGTALNSGTISSGTNLVWGISTTYTGNGGVSQFTASNGALFNMANPGYNDPYCAYYTGSIGPSCTGSDLLGAYQECPFAGMGFNFIDTGTGPKQIYSVASFTGITFWAKVDASSATGNWWFFLPTSDTDCPTCDSDSWGFTFTPTTTWTQYGVGKAFTAYSQAFGDGGADGASVNPANAYGCKWQQTSALKSYGLYIDDVYFY